MKNRNYKLNIYQTTNSNLTSDWVAKYPDIYGLIGVGDTIEKAVFEAETAKNLYLDYLEEIGEDFPIKSENSNSRGRLTLRVSKTTHQKLIDRATNDGISLNQLINDSVIYYLTSKSNNSYKEYNIRQNLKLCKTSKMTPSSSRPYSILKTTLSKVEINYLSNMEETDNIKILDNVKIKNIKENKVELLYKRKVMNYKEGYEVVVSYLLFLKINDDEDQQWIKNNLVEIVIFSKIIDKVVMLIASITNVNNIEPLITPNRFIS